MDNKSVNRAHDFIESEVLKTERFIFAVKIIATALAYAGTTYWLNAIRADAPLWLVWTLIIVQFALYLSIFIASYPRAIVSGFNQNAALGIFIVLAIAGRINNWELVVIPVTIFAMVIISTRAKNVSDARKHLLPKR